MKYVLCIISCFSFFVSKSQNFSIGGEFKPRFEYRNGYGRLRPANDSLDLAASFITQRSRLNFNYSDEKQKLSLGAVLQDVRNWGSTEQQNIGDKNTFDVHEFWIELALAERWNLKLGRHELNYDNARIVGNSDWAQQARSFDAALLKYADAKKQIQGHLVLGLNSKSETLSREIYDVNNYKYLLILWFNKKFKNLNSSLLFLNNGIEYTVNKEATSSPANRRISHSQTIGSRIEYVRNQLEWNTEGYFQGGNDASHKKLRAWNLATDIKWKTSKMLTVVLGGEILSGTGMNESDGKNHSFTPLYGTNHKFNGTMDYFFVGGRLSNKTGLEDLYASIRYKKGKFNIDLTPHVFYTMAPVLNTGKPMSSFMAVESDLAAGYKFSEIALLQGGVSALKGTSTLEFMSNGGDKNKFNSWLWTQLVVKPRFFNYSK
ncbi:alginate export family protein [Desertivirga arenae]|uniref:alginate export family protein n=1 Tax=Desertivirga arenae TaxID=2810309 RepID=UPI001A95E261|nr:alginate export family protein [Pedobacter sp. SYSU D00823]